MRWWLGHADRRVWTCMPAVGWAGQGLCRQQWAKDNVAAGASQPTICLLSVASGLAAGSSSLASPSAAIPLNSLATPPVLHCTAGYTPYEFIDFTDIALKHELVTKVDRPIRWAGCWRARQWVGCLLG